MSASWKGFDFLPEGSLIDQFIEESALMGVAYERCLQFYKKFHSHDRYILVFPRPSSSMLIKLKDSKAQFIIDSEHAIITPPDVIHDDKGLSKIYDTMALLPSRKMIQKAAADKGLDFTKIQSRISSSLKIRRSLYLDQLLEVYFIEKVLLRNNNTKTLELEYNILQEFFSIILKISSVSSIDLSIYTHTSVTKKAIQFIEAHLFTSISIDLISIKIGVSKSSLFRIFKKDTGLTPYAYIKTRRLEEAKSMLKNGQYNVSEVALLVGYENFGAFSEAFKMKWGKSPSHYKKRKN